jgi:phospholipid-transporting ATPase
MQAARASDYSINEFKILQPLLFYNGREFYRKNSMVILYNFYKNVVYLVPIFWYGTFSGYSGTFIYDLILFQLFNTMYTALPIIIYAVFDKELPQKILIKYPYFYKIGIQGRHFTTGIFWQWFFTGALHAMFICIITIFII